MPRIFSKTGRTKSQHQINLFASADHPEPFDLPPRSPQPQPQPSPSPAPAPTPANLTPRPQNSLHRSTSVSDRFSSKYSGDRRSIAVIPSGEPSPGLPPDDFATFAAPSPQLSGGLFRSQTVLRREGTSGTRLSSRNVNNTSSTAQNPQARETGWTVPTIATPGYSIGVAQGSPSPVWSPDFAQLPSPNERNEFHIEHEQGSMSNGKKSSDSGPGTVLDRFTQRRLQRLNTEQGFREQRQVGAQPGNSPPRSDSSAAGYSSVAAPHAGQQAAYQIGRTSQQAHTNAGLVNQTSPQAYNQQQYSPPAEPVPNPLQPTHDPIRPDLSQSRSFGAVQSDDTHMSSNNGGNGAAPRPLKAMSNRQSVHNGLGLRENPAVGSALQPGVPAFNASVVPLSGHPSAYKGNGQGQQEGGVGRVLPQPAQMGEGMTEEDVTQLIKDHKELREKYTKVKKYYFEKEDQVKQLQNSLAHQRLSQSRTSLDDSEYSTRFNRLDGLIAQLAFSIRKSWRSLPEWLHKSVNKDAIATGKQEMTAAGRAFISRWLVEDCFDRYFHPDLDTPLSAQLKQIQLNIRRFAPLAQTIEEEEFLTSKIVSWRLATLEGLQDALRSPDCPANRAAFTEMLNEQLIAAVAVHLQDPPPSDLAGGVHMIIELVVSIAIHLPVESRDVVIEYFKPGYSIMQEQMKLESGIPALTASIYDDNNVERTSVRSGSSEQTDMTDNSNAAGDAPRKRGMLGALTGTGKSKSQGKHAGAAGSSSSLHQPESAHGMKDETPRVRMAAGIGVSVRGRTMLVKAPIFST